MDTNNNSRMDRRMSKELLEVTTERKSMKDCKSADDFSYDKLEMLRGETPNDINEQCLKLCQQYLGAFWLQETLNTINVKRLSGGLTNQLYYCGSSKTSSIDGVPNEVAIRFYGPKHFNNESGGNERLTDMVIALLVSKNKLGPRIYGIFEDGQIQSYIKHRHFRYDEQRNPKLREELFRKLAAIHAMDVPIKKNTKNWMFEYFESFYKKAFEKFDINKIIVEQNLQTLKTYDIKKELEWLKEQVIKVNSPIVFTHIDFRGTNVMVTDPNDEIILCDYEYSSYGYRGFDFGTTMVEWNYKVDELFKSVNQAERYPDDNQLKELLTPYLEESKKIFGKKYSNNEINSIEQLIREVKIFSMVADIFIILFCLKTDDNEEDGFPMSKNIMMEMGERIYQGYFSLKQKFAEENVFL